jgi:uncharacterized membrane protein YfcA
VPDVPALLLILLIGLATGFFDSVIGAGGLISVPALIFLGLPPQVAIATDRFGTLGQSIASFWKFWRAKKIVWGYVLPLAFISLAGSLIGANILVSVDPAMLQKVVGILVIVLLPFLFLKRDLGLRRQEPSKSKKALGFLLYFLVMIFGSFFGQGTGPLVFYALTYFLGLTMIEVLATGVIPWFLLSIVSLVIFARHGIIDYPKGAILLVGMAIGAYAGSHIAIKKGDRWIKWLCVLYVLALGVKLLIFSS